MATDDVVIARFRADLDDVRRSFDEYISTLDKVKKKEDEVEKETKQTNKEQLTAAQKRTAAIKAEEAELKKLQIARKQAFTVKEIDTFNQKINQTQRNLLTLKGETQSVGSTLKSVFASIAGGFVAGLGIQNVISGLRSSIDAFLEAEQSANRLKFAITQVGEESETVFNRLLSQSKELQKQSVFSDENIQAAQTALSNFGLLGAQIEILTPKIVELAAANNIDLLQATDAVIRGIEGQTRGLTTLGLKFDDTGTAIGNFNVLLESLTKNEGAAAEQARTLAGQLAVTENRANELEETVGGTFAASWVRLKVSILGVVDALLRYGKVNETTLEDQKSIGVRAVEQTVKRMQAEGKSTEEIVGFIERRIEAQQKEIDQLDLNRRLREGRQDLTIAENKKIVEQITLIEGVVEGYKNQLALLTEIQKQQDDVLTSEQLRALNLEQLNAELAKNKKNNDIISRSNVDLINLELTARNKASEEARKQAEKDLEALKKKFGDVQKIQPIPLKVKFDENQVIEAVNEANIPGALASRPIEADVTINPGNLLDSIFKANERIIAESQELFNTLIGLSNAFTDRRIQDIEKEKNAQLTSIDTQLEALDTALENRRISETLAEKERQRLDAERVKSEKEAADKIRAVKRRQAILEKSAALIQIAINTARSASETAASVPYPANIPLVALAIALGAAQAAIVAAQPIPYKHGSKDTGKSEHLAMVGEEGPELMMMQPKSKVLPHKKVNQHAEAIDAMFDNRFEDYVYDKFTIPELKRRLTIDRPLPEPYEMIMPLLESRKKAHDEIQERTFADNITKSFIFQGIGITAVEMDKIRRKGQSITNADEIGAAIARHLASTNDPYRR